MRSWALSAPCTRSSSARTGSSAPRLLDQQAKEWWSTRVARDLRREFPVMTGLSRSNLSYMRTSAAAWPDREKVPQAAGHLPWGHAPSC
jgi:predicted nuclease of restriction endonuclease-like (RecB) superfamily